MPDAKPQEQLREEFNRWADAGKGESMEHEHWPITKPALELMQIAPDENILDVGCGSGWLSRALAKGVPEGRVVGMDISDEMIRRARQASVDYGNLVLVVGEVAEIPWEQNFFTKAISVESSYYWPDPAKGLREIYRVLAEQGSAWILINFYRDNPHSHQWAQLFRDAGFKEVAHRLIPDPTPNPAVYEGRWFRDAKQLAEFRAIGALLVHGKKNPDV
jgi:ubiquinone/menaquinone biosynthesis C-methylase UbiE